VVAVVLVPLQHDVAHVHAVETLHEVGLVVYVPVSEFADVNEERVDFVDQGVVLEFHLELDHEFVPEFEDEVLVEKVLVAHARPALTLHTLEVATRTHDRVHLAQLVGHLLGVTDVLKLHDNDFVGHCGTVDEAGLFD